jgi:lysophospholipase L1-like esterase
MNANSDRESVKPVAKKPSRLKRLLQNLTLFFVTFLIIVGIFEGVLRLNGYGNLELYTPDQKLYWKLKANQDCYTKVGRLPVHINSHNTRGPEFEVEKPPGTFRILSIGDSRTFGWGLRDEETYSRQLETRLRQYSNRPVEVINAGVNAWSYPQLLVYFREVGLAYNPDLVIVGDANAWTQFSEKSSPEFVKQMMRRVWLKNIVRRFAIYHYVVEVKLRQVYESNRQKFIPVDAKQDPLFKEQQQADASAVYRSALDEICRVAQTNGIKVILLYQPEEYLLNSTNHILLPIKQEIHEKWNVPLVDMTPALRGEGKALYLDADPSHFNARGSEIIGRLLFETTTNLLAP